MLMFRTIEKFGSAPRLLLIALLSAFAGQASAQLTDIAAEPVINRQLVTAKPNLMFILDDSGSMSRLYMPDGMSNTGTYGYLSAQCNGVAFDPKLSYLAPVYANGDSYPNASFANAKFDGYSATSGTTSLANKVYYVYSNPGAQRKMDWTYDADGKEIKTSTFYKECNSLIGADPGKSVFTAVTITSTSADAQKYANWYSYYRTRSQLMRTSVGRAVKILDKDYRVGFSRINSAAITDGIDFRDTKAFEGAQRTNFYSSLYSAPPDGGTPLRGALSKVGRYFAKKATGQTYDPMEYSCQRNYAILSTDGYWNSGGGPIEEGPTYGPYGLDGNAVGNRDASEVRPMYDGSDAIKTEKTPLNTLTRREVVKTDKKTTTSKRTVVEVDSVGCGANKFNEYKTVQTKVVETSTKTTTITAEISTRTRTVVTTNGTVSSDSTSGAVTSPQPDESTSVGNPTTTVLQDWTGTRSRTQKCQSFNQVGPASTSAATDTKVDSSSQNSTVLSVAGPTTGETTTTFSYSGGTSDTLADLAQYYYTTDLRTPALGNCTSSTSGQARDVCTNIVPTAGRDLAKTQHLTTFTLGLGTGGTLAYDKDYLQQTTTCNPAVTPFTCDYAYLSGLKTPVKNWPQTTTVLSGNSGDARNIDDLWHAAVNGRGEYFSASDASSLSQAIASIISTINSATGAGSASSFNSLSFVAGLTNQIFQAGYTSSAWIGDVVAYSVKGEDGVIGATTQWSAKAKLDAMNWTDRKIYYRKPGTSVLTDFTFANLSADGLGADFAGFCSKTPAPQQCASLPAADPDHRSAANDGNNLVKYLSGDRTNNAGNAESPLYRTRGSVLGDIINGAPVFVGKPPFNYSDAGYSAFAAAKVNRAPVVYAGANDGMLHAFNATTGAEMWAYIPTSGLSKMYRLADTDYGNNHQSFVDAEPVIADVNTGGGWKTILVGGLGLGGKAYYALDITDPLNPKSLWEFKDDQKLGLTFGNPIITKRANGTWVVVFSSGYNNVDGKGYLFVVDAGTGAKLLEVPTAAGAAGAPSGLGKINAWIDLSSNNTAKRFYGGDMLGNLWRFDIDDQVLPYKSAMLLGKLQKPDGAPQPVTTKPELMLVSGLFPVVVVGTGRYLGDTDVVDSSTQSVYIVKDPMIDSPLGVLRTSLNMVKHTVTVDGTGKSSTSSKEPIDWDVKSGWWFDLPNSGERVVSNMSLSRGTLFVASAVPSRDPCVSGGSSWLYRIDITSGLSKDPFGELFSEDSLIVGQTFAKLSDGSGRMYVRNSKGETKQYDTGEAKTGELEKPRRTSWRELIN